MPLDARKVNRHVSVRTTAGKVRPAVITAVGAGTNVDCRVGHLAETFTNLPVWSRTTPSTAGWTRDRKEV
jgi:hypothetical protein